VSQTGPLTAFRVVNVTACGAATGTATMCLTQRDCTRGRL